MGRSPRVVRLRFCGFDSQQIDPETGDCQYISLSRGPLMHTLFQECPQK